MLFRSYSLSKISYRTMVEKELLPQYATASIRRAIPSLADGFKEALRKVFYGFRHLKMTYDITVAKAAGKISALTNYHHRGTSMENTIIGMAATYAGTANVNLLLPHGQFGTRHSKQAASAAYPMTTLNNPLHTLLYPLEDDAILKYMIDEGEQVEPETYVSVIPTCLLFGTTGLAVGWKTEIPQFHPTNVIEACLDYLEDPASIRSMTPFYRGFTGDIVETSPGVWSLTGILEHIGKDTHILDIPPFKETDAFKEELCNKYDKIEIGAKHTDELVHIVVKDALLKVEDIKSMRKTINFHHVVLLNKEGKPQKFDCPQDIVRAHAEIRLCAYKRRLSHLVTKAEREMKMAESKARYVELRISGGFVMSEFKSDIDATARLDEIGGFEKDGSSLYDYLFSMQDRSFTAERARAIRETAAKKKAILEDLKTRTPENEWKRELVALQSHFT